MRVSWTCFEACKRDVPVQLQFASFLDLNEKTQTKVVWARHKIIWTGQDYPTGKCTRRETKRQTEEMMGRQHEKVEWNIILRQAENHEEWGTLVVKSTVVPQRSARLRDR